MIIDWLKHQEQALEFMEKKYASSALAALFMETGTGKTQPALQQAEKWVRAIGRGVIVCPNPLRFNWASEAAQWKVDFNLRWFEDGNRNRRISLIEGEWDALVVNYDSVRNLWPLIARRRPTWIIFDEMHRLKNRKAQQTKACKELAKGTRCRLGLTGTPVTQNPLDLWSQFDVLGAGLVHPLGLGSYTNFAKAVADVEPHPRLGWNVPIYKFPEEKIYRLRERVAPHVFQVTKEECLDLPPRNWQIVWCEMGDEQKRIYKEMQKDAVAIVDATLASTDFNSGVSSATLILTQIVKLQQIACGFIKVDDGTIKELPNCKIDALEELLPSLLYGQRKVCIWARFRHDIDILRASLEKWGIDFVWVDGRNSSEIHNIVREFRTNPTKKVIVGQVQVIREGLTLVEANSVIYFSNAHNLEWREQSQDRVYRYGQVNQVTYYDMIARGTKDLAILNRLKDKKQLAQMTVGDLRNMLVNDLEEIPF